ncbi:hypothetical protein SVIOM342S_00454 [Streptomyces violaceorubidus]
MSVRWTPKTSIPAPEAVTGAGSGFGVGPPGGNLDGGRTQRASRVQGAPVRQPGQLPRPARRAEAALAQRHGVGWTCRRSSASSRSTSLAQSAGISLRKAKVIGVGSSRVCFVASSKGDSLVNGGTPTSISR